jgi:hypothetical protein
MLLSTILLTFLSFQQDNSAEISRLQSEVSRLSSELSHTQAVLQAETRPFCSAEIHVQAGVLRVSGPDTPARANLLAMVSSPGDCLPGEIRLTATYLSAGDSFVCSGTVAVPQTQSVQNTFVEIRPYETEIFLKWWDGATLRQQAMACRDYQGNELRNPADYAASIRVFVSVFPRRGGLATSEFQMNLPRVAP